MHSAGDPPTSTGVGDELGAVVGVGATVGVVVPLADAEAVGLDGVVTALAGAVLGVLEPPVHPVTATATNTAQTGATARTPGA